MPLLEANLAAVSQNYDVIALAHSDVDSTMTWVSENLKGEITIGFSTSDMRDNLKIIGQPISLIIDTDGNILSREYGYVPNLTNLGKRLYENGFKLDKDITISDQQDEINNALNILLKDCDVVITSGGLGPTEDDITKETISDSLSMELELDDDHLEWMKERWKARGLIMPDTNIQQAYIPVGSEKLTNTQGTAPGIKINHNNKFIFIFPGPPREFIPLVEDELIPFLNQNYEKENTDYQFVMFFNQAESSLAAEIDKFKPEGLDIAYLASKGIIKLRIDKNSVSEDAFKDFKNQIKETLSDNVLSYETFLANIYHIIY